MVELFEPDLLVEDGIGADPALFIGSGEVEMDSRFERSARDENDSGSGIFSFDFPAEDESAVRIFEHDFGNSEIEIPSL